MKKLKLEKLTIANLNEKEMTKIEGGQETMAGPQCVSVEPTCDTTGHPITNIVICK